MRYITSNLSKEILEKYNLISSADKSKTSVACQRLHKKAIEENSRIHSFRIENPHLNVPFSIPKGKNRKLIKEGIENLKDAFELGKKYFNPSTFDESFIRGIAGKITPELYIGEVAEYRKDGVNITGASVTPPYPYKMREIEMPKFIDSLNDKFASEDPMDKVRAAFYSHLHLARIHPFEDGNGRTARIFQDIILDHSGFPLPVIEVGERNTYYEIIDKAVYDWKYLKDSGEVKSGATEGEHLFYTFLAGKLNISLDKILESCSH